MTAHIPLGPFELVERIGRGGMAEVWRAVHVQQRAPVAIKLITADRARQPHLQDAFLAEVEAVARLHHPGIVTILDHGSTTLETERLSGGEVTAGSPYLAMELASGGSLDRLHLPLGWQDLLPVLLSLLDALAHAHARGVIHRDLKPANVLLCTAADLRPGLKLTDFGIAHALESQRAPGTTEASSGTPHFMAPEQFFGHWREYGPWTDLYAVGCVAFLLASGRLPYQAESPMQLAWAHTQLPPPRLEPSALPEQLEAWVRRMMQKDPADRFQRAADAGWALMCIAEAHRRRPDAAPDVLEPDTLRGARPPEVSVERLTATVRAQLQPSEEQPTDIDQRPLGRAVVESSGGFSPSRAARPDAVPLATLAERTLAGGTLPWAGATSFGSASLTPEDLERAASGEPAYPRRIPPLPVSWKRRQSQAPVMPLVGAGLGLYGMRAVPMVDRDRERDLVWSTLRTVREDRRARGLILHGAAGSGKSRLAEWMGQRAEEVGGGTLLKVCHSPTPGPQDGLLRAMERHLRAVDLGPQEVLARLQRGPPGLEASEALGLSRLLRPTGRPSTLRAEETEERHQLLRRVLERVAAERTVLLWLDDAQWGPDSLLFARRLLAAQRETPSRVLLLLTVREEALAERPREAELLQALARRPEMERLAVPPLSREDQELLVEALLVLEPGLARQVATRTGGNPLFAVQLVGDWVQRGVLRPGSQGFVLQAGQEALLPDDIHQLWRARVERVLAGQPAGAERALELAAALGQRLESGEWLAACRAAGVELPQRLLESLKRSRLAREQDGTMELTHTMLRESLERSAREAGRHADHHRACARMLASQPAAAGRAERVGLHLVAAHDLRQALAPLLAGAEESFQASDFARAQELLEARDDALAELGAQEDEPAWGEGWLLRARLALVLGELSRAEEWANHAERYARRWGWRALLPASLLEHGRASYERGEHLAAIELFTQAAELYRWNQDAAGIARAELGLGDAYYRRGDFHRAGMRYAGALATFEESGDAEGTADALLGLGYIELWTGRVAEATRYFQRYLPLVEGTGSRHRVARGASALGEAARQAGRLVEAEFHYRRALGIDEAIGASAVWVDRMNLGLVLLARGAYPEARAVIEAVLGSVDDGEPARVAVVCTEVLPCYAEAERWEDFQQALRRGQSALVATGMRDGDVAWSCQLAGELALSKGRPEHARPALELSRAQWMALGRADRLAAVESLLARLPARPPA